MCSKKCDSPVMPGASLREPTFQKVYMFALGMVLFSSTMNFMPFGRVKLLTSSAVTACAAAAMPNISEAARTFHFMAILSGMVGVARSEEHTSELQSRRDLVCRLLLEKKKKKKLTAIPITK